jgi:hypothetical protein
MTSLAEAEARAVIAPWYSLFNFASRGDVRAIQEQILTEDSESCAGYLPAECWGRETSIEVVSNFANPIPDMKFDIKKCWWLRIASSCAARLPARPRAPACAIGPGKNHLKRSLDIASGSALRCCGGGRPPTKPVKTRQTLASSGFGR